MVLVDAERQVGGFEGFVAVVFDLARDLEDLGARERVVAWLVFGEVLVGIARWVGLGGGS